jgi:hypothetical protein
MVRSQEAEMDEGAYPPWHDCSEAWPDRDHASGSEGLPSTAEAGLHAPVYTVRADRPQEMTCNIVVDTPGVGVQISFCGHDNRSDGWVVAHICTPLYMSRQVRQKSQPRNV